MQKKQQKSQKTFFQQMLQQPQNSLIVQKKKQKHSQSQQDQFDLSWGSRRQWNPRFVFKTVTYPIQNLKTQANKHMRFMIKFFYYDQKGKQRSKVIYFGQKDKKQFIDDHDQIKKKKKIFRYIRGGDFFHPQFWRIYLLNNKPSIEQSFIQLVKKIKLNKNQSSS